MKLKKKDLVAILVAIGVFSLPNAMKYVDSLSNEIVIKSLKEFKSILKSESAESIKNREIVAAIEIPKNFRPL